MAKTNHYAILIGNDTKTQTLAKKLRSGGFPGFEWLRSKSIGEFSKTQLERFIEEEEIHDQKFLTQHTSQSLLSMSSGERKKVLLRYLLGNQPQVLLTINPYDSLDVQTQAQLKADFETLSETLSILQLSNRVDDIFPFVQNCYRLTDGGQLEPLPPASLKQLKEPDAIALDGTIPPPINPIPITTENLVVFNNINVSFDERPVLKDISWTIKPGEFWQLMGPNGSGKSTLLNMISGDCPKGYGQDLTLFGHKKGSGESVWDIKQLMGYFSPPMMDRFSGYHTLEHMVISGLHDSVGLYQKPTMVEKNLASQWLEVLDMLPKKDRYFHQLSQGDRRLIMTARAMIKHPPLLILDEPTVGLDDQAAAFFVALVNKFASESQSTVIFVSHRYENGLRPKTIFRLHPSDKGSTGTVEQ